MRIRKRFPPPPSLPSDPQLIHNSLLVVVQQQQEQEQVQQAKTNSQPFGPSDQSHNHPSTSDDQEPVIKHAHENLVSINKRVELGEIGGNHTRKEGIQGPKTSSHEVVLSVPPSSSCHQVFEGWYGEDIAIPIKKRRGSLGKSVNDEGSMTKKEEKTVMEKTMKSKTNKKCVQENGEEQESGKGSLISKLEGTDQMINNGLDAKKNVKRGSVIMEGSRCSRVNGRGWRCCQQTLVGYSLCEHHLGKGRLRSRISVRNRAKPKKGTQAQEKKSETMLVHNEEQNDDDDDDDDEISDDDFMILQRKKKKKIGMVKARSISSLLRLGQTDSGTSTEVMVDENDKKIRAVEDK